MTDIFMTPKANIFIRALKSKLQTFPSFWHDHRKTGKNISTYQFIISIWIIELFWETFWFRKFSNIFRMFSKNIILNNLLSLVWTSFRLSKWFRRNLSGFGTDVRDDVEDRIFSRMIFSEASYNFASSSFRRSTHNVNSSLINYYESLVQNTVVRNTFWKFPKNCVKFNFDQGFRVQKVLIKDIDWFVREAICS